MNVNQKVTWKLILKIIFALVAGAIVSTYFNQIAGTVVALTIFFSIK